MSDPVSEPFALSHLLQINASMPRIMIDDKPLMHVAVAMSTISPNGFPLAVAFGKSGWSDVVSLLIRPADPWIDREWDEQHVAATGISRQGLARDGLPARAVARFVQAAIRDHVLVARMAGFQRHWLETLLDLCDDPFPGDWIEHTEYLRLIAHGLGLPSARLSELAGRHSVENQLDARAASEVTAQLSFVHAICHEASMANQPRDLDAEITLRRPAGGKA
jgi:DNA polymerase III epsilon subunit-like protein